MEESVRLQQGGGGGQPPGGQVKQPPYNIGALAMQTASYDVGSLRSGSSRQRRGLQLSYVGPPPKSAWERFKDGFRAFIAFVFSNIGICVLVIGYLLVGAVMFQQLEGPGELQVRYRVGQYRQHVVKRLWTITEQYNTLHPDEWTREVTQIVNEYQARIIQEANDGYDGSDIPIYQWTFTGALLYSITVITTIGYGHISPKTPVGKLVTIFYAIIGIPLFLLYLSNIGDIMAKSFKWTYSRLCKCQRGSSGSGSGGGGILKRTDNFSIKYLPGHVHGVPPPQLPPHDDSNSSIASGVADMAGSEDYSEEFQPSSKGVVLSSGTRGGIGQSLDKVTVPISLCLLVMVGYVCGGALLFGEWEGWGFLDGSYFCFITLSTIGFGDIVPGAAVAQDPGSSSKGVAPVNTKFVLCSMYILIGMALIAMCFNLMQEKVIQGVRSIGKKLSRSKD